MKKEDLEKYEKAKKISIATGTAKAQRENLIMIDLVQLKSSSSSGGKVIYDIPLHSHYLSHLAVELVKGMGVELDKRIKNLEKEFEEL